MRGSIVVLALAVTPLFASVSQAQNGHGPHWQKHWTPGARHDDGQRGKSDDNKCEDRKRGNPSDNGLNHRADPRTKGNKDCDLGVQNPPPPPPPPAVDTAGSTEIDGAVFFDVDHDGAFGPDEVGLSGWTVQVSGPMTASAVTDGNGAYAISGLIAGDYTVCVLPPMGWAQTSPGTGLGLPTCSNGTVGFGLNAPAVSGLTQYTGVDFGFVSM
jgi:hypothetical protein